LVDDLRFGPFSTCSTTDKSCSVCNSGEQIIIPIIPIVNFGTYKNNSFEAINAYKCSWSTCFMEVKLLNYYFLQTIPLTGENSNIGIAFQIGLNTAFSEYNGLNGFRGKKLVLYTVDDFGSDYYSLNNLKNFLKYENVYFI